MKKLLTRVLNTAQQMVDKVESIHADLSEKIPSLAKAYQASLASLDEEKKLRDQYYHNSLSGQISLKEYQQYCLVVATSQKRHGRLCRKYFSINEACIAAEIFLALLKADIHVLHVNIEKFTLDDFMLHLKDNFSIFNSRLNLLIKLLKNELIHNIEDKSYLESIESFVVDLRSQLSESLSNNKEVVISQPVIVSRFNVQEVASTVQKDLIHVEACHKLLMNEFRHVSILKKKLVHMEGDVLDKFILIAKQDSEEVSIDTNRVFISLIQMHMSAVVEAGILPADNPFKLKHFAPVELVARRQSTNTFFANSVQLQSPVLDESQPSSVNTLNK